MRKRISILLALFSGSAGIVAGLSLVLAATAGLAAELFVTDSLAVFTDQEVNAANTFATGAVSIDDGPDSAFFTYSAMLPGDTTIQALTITNSGASQFRYAMTTVADNADTKNLRDQLQVTIRVKTANPCSSEDGTVIYGPGTLALSLFGNPAQGNHAGDRLLAGAASEILCFKAELPLSTNNTFMNASTTATFTFDAEQTANNP